MEIKGEVISILPKQTFTSQRTNKTYVWITFILKTEGAYPKKVALQVEGEERFAKMNIKVGGVYNVSFDAESTEWNGKWFTKLTVWRVENANGDAPTPQATKPRDAVHAPKYEEWAQTSASQRGNNSDEFPF